MVNVVARPVTKEAYKLFHEGTLALSEIESNGMRIDVEYLKRARIKCQKKIGKLAERLKDDRVYRKWDKRFGKSAKIDDRLQFSAVVFEELGYERRKPIKGEDDKNDEAAFWGIDEPFVKMWIKREKYKKIDSTYLKTIERELCGDLIHPNINLGHIKTFRSSINDPSLQNFPIRNKMMGKIIRSAVIPLEKDHVIVEIDFSVLEVKAGVCYHFDKNMIRYIQDPTTDMHRDQAMQCYKLKREEVSDLVRDTIKNGYVFPEFYGDWYITCARRLWEAIEKYNLKTTTGVGLKEHLARHGITKMGTCDPDIKECAGDTFEAHLKASERKFWDVDFAGYNAWKEDWWQRYLRTGSFTSLTGFFIGARLLSRKDASNWPIQGSAFHILLKCIIKLSQWLKRNKLRSKLITEIHDSLIASVHIDELDDYIAEARYVMTRWIREVWDWIIVPLTVKVEVAPLGGSWFDKEKYNYDGLSR